MYFSEDTLEALKKEAKKRDHTSVQNLIRQIIRENLRMELPIKNFQTDALCPQCGTAGQLVEYPKKVSCLNCGYVTA